MEERKDYGTSDHPPTKAEQDARPGEMPASVFEGHRLPVRSTWLEEFESREQKSIDAARLYVAHYDHGEPGHLHLRIIAKLAALLDRELLGIKTEYVVDRRLVDISGGQ